MSRLLRACVAVAAASALLLAAAQVPARARSGDDIAAVRAATAQFKSVAAAEDAGYTPLVDAAGIACIDIALVIDPTFNPTTPEVLVYEPDNHGNLNLVAVEYVAFEADWAGESPPVLFGEHFHRMAGAGESEPATGSPRSTSYTCGSGSTTRQECSRTGTPRSPAEVTGATAQRRFLPALVTTAEEPATLVTHSHASWCVADWRRSDAPLQHRRNVRRAVPGAT